MIPRQSRVFSVFSLDIFGSLRVNRFGERSRKEVAVFTETLLRRIRSLLPLLTPKLDFVFKLLFTKDREILLDLVNTVLAYPEHLHIQELEVKNPIVLPEELSEKFIILDILAVDEAMRKSYTNPMIHKAFEVLETLSADELTRQRAEIREKALKNEVSMLEDAREEGIQQGIQQGQLQKSCEDVIDILQARFERVPEAIIETINSLDDLAVLKELLKKAATVSSVEEFAARLPYSTQTP